jgi:hypothetical protein
MSSKQKTKNRRLHVRGVFRIKCAGWNIFNTNHCRNSAISGLFKALLGPIRTYWSQQSIYRQKAAVGLFFLLVWVTPSKFFMRPTWDTESIAGFDFASLKQKKVHPSRIQWIERPADRLDTFATIKSPGIRCQRSLFLCPPTKTGPGTTIWDISAWKSAGMLPELFWRKLHWRFHIQAYYSAVSFVIFAFFAL